MYVFYPADELLRIYENPIRDSLSVDATSASVDQERYYLQQRLQQLQQQQQRVAASKDARKRKKERKREIGQPETRRQTGKREGRRWEEQHTGTMQNNRASGSEEAANHPLKDLTQPSLNESLKQHNGVALKLVQTGEYASFVRFLPA